MSKTHWKKTIDKDWIGCYILPPSGKPDTGESNSNPYLSIQVKLLKVKLEKVKVKGVLGEYKVAYFAKNEYFDKPMLLSAAANLKRIAKITNSNYIEDWEVINKDVILQAEWDKSFGGGKDWALRIVEIKGKPELKEGTVDWTAAMKYVTEGGDPANLRAKKVISDVLFKKLEDAKSKK